MVFTDVLDDPSYQTLLANATCFVFPSLAEGFGIPPLEAMASGTPVLTSNTSCLPEVCGDAAYYFNPKDTNDIAAKMKEMLKSKKLRDTLIGKGFARVKRFSWKKMAEETLEVYESVLGLE